MNPRPTTPEVTVRPDERTTARTLVDALLEQVADREDPHVGLTGGSMGVEVAREIGARWATDETAAALLDRTHWWFSDERFLPEGHADRNDTQVLEALGTRPAPERWHVLAPAPGDDPSRDEAEAAAVDQAAELAMVPRHEGLPSLDLLVLGVGPDCHVASLFPGHPDSAVHDRWTTAVDDSPKPPPVRVSFTMPVIRAAEQVWLVACGEGKAEALAGAREAFAGCASTTVAARAGEPLDRPAGWAQGRTATRWFLDEAAAARLPAA
ncbi:6-phosphogluconolactonase [Kytococcus aerolatus]|uniref:6-phosphogluconolactonase n=1 Tax=Kytococcus aerolatus TaxID=592308 RepID=A0A212T0H3_9MICO|nr:6-phosphogluconolactonase [Kytococcus aerolatus]SNC59505.1 6-phosphogluconolactonase [Kytococcus aerolatus]